MFSFYFPALYNYIPPTMNICIIHPQSVNYSHCFLAVYFPHFSKLSLSPRTQYFAVYVLTNN